MHSESSYLFDSPMKRRKKILLLVAAFLRYEDKKNQQIQLLFDMIVPHS